MVVTYPTALKNLLAATDAGTVTTSQQASTFVLTEIGKTAAQLEVNHEAWGAAQ